MKKIASCLLILVLEAAILFSGYLLIDKLGDYKKEHDIKIKRTTEIRDGRTVDFEKLKKINSDAKGWIWLPGTNIDYPIVQGENNDYYLHKDIDGKYLFDGCIFIDAAIDIPFESDVNTVIYGHHMMSGAMFHDLSKFVREEGFMKDHGTFVIETESGSYDLEVVAYCNEESNSNLYTTYFSELDPSFGHASEENELTKRDFVELIREKAKILSDVPFGEDDIYVTLSTCAYNYGDARHQVIGILKPAETKEVITQEHVKSFNKWSVFQILVYSAMALFTILLVLSFLKECRR